MLHCSYHLAVASLSLDMGYLFLVGSSIFLLMVVQQLVAILVLFTGGDGHMSFDSAVLNRKLLSIIFKHAKDLRLKYLRMLLNEKRDEWSKELETTYIFINVNFITVNSSSSSLSSAIHILNHEKFCCAKDCPKFFTCIISFNPHNSCIRWVQWLSPHFPYWKTEAQKRFRNFPKVPS